MDYKCSKIYLINRGSLPCSLLDMCSFFVQVLVYDLAVERLQCAQRSANPDLSVYHRGHSSDFALGQFVKCLSLHFESKIRLHGYGTWIIGCENMAVWLVLQIYHHDLILVCHLVGHHFIQVFYHFAALFIDRIAKHVVHVSEVIWVLRGSFAQAILVEQLGSRCFYRLSLLVTGPLKVKWRLVHEVGDFMSQVLIDFAVVLVPLSDLYFGL